MRKRPRAGRAKDLVIEREPMPYGDWDFVVMVWAKQSPDLASYKTKTRVRCVDPEHMKQVPATLHSVAITLSKDMEEERCQSLRRVKMSKPSPRLPEPSQS